MMENLGLIVTLIGITIANVGTIVALFLWSTNNANEFRKESSLSLNEFRKESTTALNEHKKEMSSILKSIADEMKDFHQRLLEIEMSRKL